METLNYEPIANRICNAVANTGFTHSIAQARELSRGYIATNSLHIELLLEDLPDVETDGVSLLIKKAILKALREQGLTPKVTQLFHNSFDNLIIEAYGADGEGDLYATIHLVTWDLEIAVTTTQYYL